MKGRIFKKNVFVRPYTLVNAWSRLIPEAILVMASVVVRLVTTRELGVSYFFHIVKRYLCFKAKIYTVHCNFYPTGV